MAKQIEYIPHICKLNRSFMKAKGLNMKSKGNKKNLNLKN